MKRPFNFLTPNRIKQIVIGFLIMVASIAVLYKLTEMSRGVSVISYSAFLDKVEQNFVRRVHVAGKTLVGMLKDGTRFETVLIDDQSLWPLLRRYKVDVHADVSGTEFPLWAMALLALVGVLVGVAIWFFVRQARGLGSGGGNVFSMGKSKARMYLPSELKERFTSVAGADEAKEELADVVDFLKHPSKYRRLGAKIPRGVLLVGEPGNGKTLLARAVAGEANCPFFSTSGSDFIEIFVGVGAARVRELFERARKHAPCIIFIDEIDAVGRHRGSGLGGGHDEREQTLNQLLSEMDGFVQSKMPVIVIAATNRPDVLDSALLRPGRFDRRVIVPFPDLQSRLKILQVHAKGVKISVDVDLQKVARGTPGFSGADLANLINESAVIASKRDADEVSMKDFEDARDKIILGKEVKSILLTEEDKRLIAYHEAGHALVRLLLPQYSNPLHKISIIPRGGGSLGVTHSMPEREKYIQTKEEMEAEVMSALGGRAAEEVAFNTITTGAASDFRASTRMLRNMITRYGMSSTIGLVAHDQGTQGDYPYAPNTADQIDSEIKQFADLYYAKAKQLLADNRDKLDLLAKALLEKETLYAGDVYGLLGITPREDLKLA
jgi:cell division protease FtsH